MSNNNITNTRKVSTIYNNLININILKQIILERQKEFCLIFLITINYINNLFKNLKKKLLNS